MAIKKEQEQDLPVFQRYAHDKTLAPKVTDGYTVITEPPTSQTLKAKFAKIFKSVKR